MNIQPEHLKEEHVPLLVRRILYLFLSAATCDPHLDRVELLYDENFLEDLRLAYRTAIGSMSDHVEPGPGERPPAELEVEPLLSFLNEGRRNWQEEYRKVFGHTLSKECPPCAVEYSEKTDVFYRSQRLSDIAGFYRAFGLEKSDRWTDREDHLGLMCEFMSLLAQKQLYGLIQDHEPEQVDVTAQAEEDFFREHIAWWVGSFADKLRAETDSSYYENLGRFLASFLPMERHYFDMEPVEDMPEPSVIEYDPEEGCGTNCGMGGRPGGDDAHPGATAHTPQFKSPPHAQNANDVELPEANAEES